MSSTSPINALRRLVFAASWLSAAAASVQAQGDKDPRSKAEVRMPYLLGRIENQNVSAEERQKLVQYAQKECQSAAARPSVQKKLIGQLVQSFDQSYIANGNGSIPLDVVTTLEGELPEVFGHNNELIIDWLNRPYPPGAWQRADFRNFLGGHMEKAGASALRTDVGSQSPRDSIIRWGFLATVAAAEQTRFVTALENWCQNAKASAMPEIVGPQNDCAFSQLESALGGSFSHRTRLEGMLAKRLYDLPAPDWNQAQNSLLYLARIYPGGVEAFFKKASDYVYDHRSDSAGSRVLVTLTEHVDARKAFGEWLGSDPRKSDVEWFKWLHQPGLLTFLHNNSSKTVDDSLELLEKFASPAEQFPRMHDLAVNYYYDRRSQAVFDDLLRPYARTPHTQLILSDALSGRFQWKHRETLGWDLLDTSAAGGAGAQTPGWPGGASRLEAAMQLYCHLPDGNRGQPSYSELVNSPLLDRIVDELIKLIKRTPPEINQVVNMFDPAATMLDANRRNSYAGTESAPLRKLESELAGTILGNLAGLSQPPADGTLSAEAGANVDNFISLTRLCMRLNSLIRKASGHAPEWLGQVRKGVAEKVFGLDTSLSEPAYLDWPENVRRFRAQILLRLDAPLASCLSEETDEAQRWWREIYMPQVRVKSMLTTLKGLGGNGSRPWPHLAWIEAQGTINADRLDDVFEMLRTTNWLDAADPVRDFAGLDLARLNSSRQQIWEVDPEILFARKWSINAGWLTWKEFLDQNPPLTSREWRLQRIILKAIQELKTLPNKSIPNCPSSDGYAPWVLNVLTAAEWQDSPFLDATDRQLPWASRVMPSGDSSKPFAMHINGVQEASRRVRSDVRMSLIKDVLVPNAVTTQGSGESVNQLVDATLYLANGPDNQDSSSSVDLAACRIQRQNAYSLANLRYQLAGNFDDRYHWLRQMMLLHASNRKQPPLVANAETNSPGADQTPPAFPALLEDEIKKSDVTTPQGQKFIALKAELIKLQNLADGGKEEGPAGTRRQLSLELHALVPDNLLDNPALMRRNWQARLDALDEEDVERQMELLSKFETLLKNEGGAFTNAVTARDSDLALLGMALMYVDFHINFSRRDFVGTALLGPTHPARVKIGEGQWKDNGVWWPAISILAWWNQTLKTALEDAAQKAVTSEDKEAVEMAQNALNKLVLANESQFLTICAAAQDSRRDQIFAFVNDMEMRLHNFRLLAESTRTVRTSADQLTADSFQAVMQNLRLVVHSTPTREDHVLEMRFFRDLGAGAPSHLRRQQYIQPNTNTAPPPRLCLDLLALHAAAWMADPGMPAALRNGSQEFLNRMPQEHFPLFSGAETPKGVANAVSGVLARLRSDSGSKSGAGVAVSRQYADFWNHLLMGPPNQQGQKQISGSLYNGLAETMFRTWETATNRAADITRQRGCFEGLLHWWRDDLEKSPEPPSSGTYAFQNGLGDPLQRLLRGEGRTNSSPYVWEPADKMESETRDVSSQLDSSGPLSDAVKTSIEHAHLNDAPEQFLDLAKWYFGLHRASDPPQVRALFELANSSTPAAPPPQSVTR